MTSKDMIGSKTKCRSRRGKLPFFLASLTFFLFLKEISAETRLGGIFGDHMVLQRDQELLIWGYGDPDEKIMVSFNGQQREVVTDTEGNWSVLLDPMQAGGPFQMTVKGKNEVVLNDILIGDVWFCSGQSNMEMSVASSANSGIGLAESNTSKIRLFTAPGEISTIPLIEVKDSKWSVCNEQTSAKFSAVAYYFGRTIHKELNVPIGLINSSYGGTGIETWTSPKGLSHLNQFREPLKDLKHFDKKYAKVMEQALLKKSGLKEFPVTDEGMDGNNPIWADPSKNYSHWPEMEQPKKWKKVGLVGLDGVVWHNRRFSLSLEEIKDSVFLHLGKIDDKDLTWINGNLVGSTEERGAERIYTVPNQFLSSGDNLLTVRIENYGIAGGFISNPRDLYLRTNSRKIPLSGPWNYKIGQGEFSKKDLTPNTLPCLLFNGMVKPYVRFKIKGILWYQGENDVERGYEYRQLLPGLIKDWREQWGSEVPFLFVQLPNYNDPLPNPSESHWAELREAQEMALREPNTGMVVTIDLGDASNIHPKNKKDVGDRLAQLALQTVYHKKSEGQSPLFDSHEIMDGKIRILFNNSTAPLEVRNKYGYINGFSIAGEDRKFHWAKAELEGDNSVLVHSPKVKHPVAVRYAWGDNPGDINLYNNKGLPAAPFRTDDWPGISVKNMVKY